MRTEAVTKDPTGAAAWPLVINSAVAYALAFNLIFFIQELFLVLPKAVTPGLQPTLYHNNHTWSGDNPIAALLQGTGAVAIIIAGLVCVALLPALRQRSSIIRLLVIWLAYHGLVMGLAQIPVGALLPGADFGMAMNYLGWSLTTEASLAILALIGVVLASLRLARFLFELASTPEAISTAGRRHRFILKAGTLAALFGTVLIIPFRIPRELTEVLGPPIVVAIIGIPWLQAGAWMPRTNLPSGEAVRGISWSMVAALLLVLGLFHIVLAPGIRFY